MLKGPIPCVLMTLAMCLIVTHVSGQNPPRWVLTWSDEFDGPGLDKTKWDYEVNCWGGGNDELQCYTDRPTNVRVQEGNLVLSARVEDYTGTHHKCTLNTQQSCTWAKPYTSGRIRTLYDPLGSWKYGRFEVSAKLPKGKHLWPAIWMLPTTYEYGIWPQSGEIDIMEYRGQETDIIMSALHFGPRWPNNQYITSGKVRFNGTDFSQGYHLFAVEWDEVSMKFFVDNRIIWTVDTNRMWYSGSTGANPYTKKGQPWDQPFHMILNLAVGGAFFNGMGSLTTAEARNWAQPHMFVDYVRVYRQSNAVCGDGACTDDEDADNCAADCYPYGPEDPTDYPSDDETTPSSDPEPTSGETEQEPTGTSDETETTPSTTDDEPSTTADPPTNPPTCDCCCNPSTTDGTGSNTGHGIPNDPNFNQGEQGSNDGSSTKIGDMESRIDSHNRAIQAISVIIALFGIGLVAAIVFAIFALKKLKQSYQTASTISPSENNIGLGSVNSQ